MNHKPSSTHKKVLVECEGGNTVRGYVNPRQFEQEDGMELLDDQGQVRRLPWREVRAVWFVRNWDQPLPPSPRVFARRPRLEGLWVRLHFRDDTTLEGVLVNDLLHLSPYGYLLTPPQFMADHQKVFVPKTALAELRVLGVIPPTGTRRRRAPAPARQPGLFPA